jgi:hypothetical protein
LEYYKANDDSVNTAQNKSDGVAGDRRKNAGFAKVNIGVKRDTQARGNERDHPGATDYGSHVISDLVIL